MYSSPILTCCYLQSLRFSIQKAFTFQYSLADLGIKFFHFSHLCLLSVIYWLHFIYSTTTRFYCSDKSSIFFVCHVGLFHKSNNTIKWGTVFLQRYDHIKIIPGMNFFRICHPDLNSEPVETPYPFWHWHSMQFSFYSVLQRYSWSYFSSFNRSFILSLI